MQDVGMYGCTDAWAYFLKGPIKYQTVMKHKEITDNISDLMSLIVNGCFSSTQHIRVFCVTDKQS